MVLLCPARAATCLESVCGRAMGRKVEKASLKAGGKAKRESVKGGVGSGAAGAGDAGGDEESGALDMSFNPLVAGSPMGGASAAMPSIPSLGAGEEVPETLLPPVGSPPDAIRWPGVRAWVEAVLADRQRLEQALQSAQTQVASLRASEGSTGAASAARLAAMAGLARPGGRTLFAAQQAGDAQGARLSASPSPRGSPSVAGRGAAGMSLRGLRGKGRSGSRANLTARAGGASAADVSVMESPLHGASTAGSQ